MKLRPSFVMALFLALLLVPIAVSARRFANSQFRLHATQASLASTANDTRRVLALRQSQQRIADQKRPEQDVIARVNATLAEMNIPLVRFAGLRLESDSALPGAAAGGGPQYRRQTVQVRLRQLTLPELGAFLCQWSASQDLWTPTRIELSHVRKQIDPARYDATMLVSATYVAER